jgi:hypothetical protein
MRLHPRYGRRARGAVIGLLTLVAAEGSATAIARPPAARTSTLDRALSSARARVGAPGAEATVVACGRDSASDRIWRAVVHAYDSTNPPGCAG